MCGVIADTQICSLIPFLGFYGMVGEFIEAPFQLTESFLRVF